MTVGRTTTRRLRAGLVLLTIVTSASSGAAFENVSAGTGDVAVVGDVDGSGAFTRADLRVVRRAARRRPAGPLAALAMADVASPCDGQPNARDLRLLAGALRRNRGHREPVVSECHRIAIGTPTLVVAAACPDGPCVEPDPDDDRGGGSGGGPVLDARPDVMIQLSVGCGIVEELIPEIVEAVPGSRARCDNGFLRVGVWLGLGGTPAQRDAAMLQLSPIAGAETMALFINGDAVRRNISSLWGSQPKRLNMSGEPDSDGSIHLSFYEWGVYKSWLPFPYGLVTVHGEFDPFIGNNVDWTAKVYDFSGIDSAGQLTCSTSGIDIDIDTWLPLEEIFDADDLDLLPRGPLCQALDMVNTATSQLLVAGGKRVVFAYSRLTNSGDDVIAGGTWALEERNPAITSFTTSANPIKVKPAQTTFSTQMTAHLRDLRPPLTVTWWRRSYVQGAWGTWTKTTAGGFASGSLGEPGAWIRGVISWPRPTVAATPTSVAVYVEVEDQDGKVAEASRTIQVQKVSETGWPPVCDTKPYLPQCTP